MLRHIRQSYARKSLARGSSPTGARRDASPTQGVEHAATWSSESETTEGVLRRLERAGAARGDERRPRRAGAEERARDDREDGRRGARDQDGIAHPLPPPVP